MRDLRRLISKSLHAKDSSTTPKLSEIFYPSFALPMLDIEDYKAVKIYGVCSGLRIRVSRRVYEVSHNDSFCLEYADYLLGLWLDIDQIFSDVRGVFREIIEILSETYSSYGISVSPLDDVIVFTSIYLSKNTDYHNNTVRWVREILRIYRDPMSLIIRDPREVLDNIGRSFQLRELPQALECYSRIRDHVLRNDSDNYRSLLRCKGVGPKILYSYMLHVKLDTSYAPFDVNLERFLANMNLRIWKRRPDKNLCILYSCNTCPIRDSCGIGILRSYLGRALGWFQTVAYMHVKSMCRMNACDRCSLRRICISRSSL
ncbi:MAG: hypothetical protein QXS45_05780 [Sulfolobales archaeon]